jgi:hypothetical protein
MELLVKGVELFGLDSGQFHPWHPACSGVDHGSNPQKQINASNQYQQMKAIKHLLVVAVAATVFGYAGAAQAQGFDRNEFTKRMVDRMREQLKVDNDDEWAIISERIRAVMEVRFSGFSGRGPGGPGRG